jgi:tripartite ATP-independent transporter DctM subunit
MSLLVVLVAAILGCMLIGVPIGFAIIAGSLVAILTFVPGANLMIVPQQIFGGLDSFTLLAIPCFLLAGGLMTAGGMTERLLAFTNAVLGRFHGGLAMSNVFAATVFAGISGSAVADTSALGRVMIPAMIRERYHPGFAAAVNAASNVMAPIIPPSIAFIVMGVLTGQSITRLFLAGVMIGLVYGLAMLVTVAWIARKREYPVHGKSSFAEIGRSFRDAVWALMMPLIIILGIRTGIFNVTECSAIAVVYALFVGTVVYRELTPARIYGALVGTARTTAIIMVVVGAAKIFSWILGYAGLPQQIANAFLAATDNPWVFLILLNILLLVVGMFMEANAALIMLVPVLFPVALKLGIDPIHVSVVIVVNLCIGLITPPVGLCLNLSSLMAGVSLEKGTREVLPFLGFALLVLALITFVPGLATWFPDLLLGPH